MTRADMNKPEMKNHKYQHRGPGRGHVQKLEQKQRTEAQTQNSR